MDHWRVLDNGRRLLDTDLKVLDHCRILYASFASDPIVAEEDIIYVYLVDDMDVSMKRSVDEMDVFA